MTAEAKIHPTLMKTPGLSLPHSSANRKQRATPIACRTAGNGAWGMSLAEVLACVREQTPTAAMVFNITQWGTEKKNQIHYYDDRYVGNNLDNPSLAAIARTTGVKGAMAEKPEEVGDALRAATNSNRPSLIEVMADQTLAEPFRRDALTKPVRLLEKPRDYSVE